MKERRKKSSCIFNLTHYENEVKRERERAREKFAHKVKFAFFLPSSSSSLSLSFFAYLHFYTMKEQSEYPISCMHVCECESREEKSPIGINHCSLSYV